MREIHSKKIIQNNNFTYMNKQYVEYVRAYALPKACSNSLKFNQR